MSENRFFHVRRLVFMGLAAALAYVVTFIQVPMFGFLTYDPKDVVIVLAGFVVGPLGACLIAVIVAGIEMLTISATGPIGFVMNAASSMVLAGIAALIYKHNPTFKGALIGVVAGGLTMVALMLALNYALVPIYMGVPREAVVALMLPVLLPFNLVKVGINGMLILILFVPFMMLRKRADIPQG